MPMVVFTTESEDGMTLTVSYEPKTGVFTVVVRRGDVQREACFPALHEPRFGTDVYDRDHALAIAERLSQEIEAGG